MYNVYIYICVYITHYMYPIYKPYNKMASYTALSAGAH